MNHELAERCKGRWPDILRRLGMLSSAALAGRDSPCPMCGGRDRFRFSDKGYGRWFCRHCAQGGDGVRLVMSIKRIDFALAAAIIESIVGKVSYASASGEKDPDAPKDPMKPWRNAGLWARGSPADVYLKGRGLDVTDEEALSLRFSPAQWHWPSSRRWPAMVACVALADGTGVTSHMTFLEPDGSGKAPLEKQRLFSAGGRTKGGGVWFGKPDEGREFIVAEGVESTLSAMRLFNVTAGCAALSESGIRALILPPEARRVRVFCDHDELQQSLLAARDASRRWKAEGRQVAATMAEKVGEDANNVWLRRCR